MDAASTLTTVAEIRARARAKAQAAVAEFKKNRRAPSKYSLALSVLVGGDETTSCLGPRRANEKSPLAPVTKYPLTTPFVVSPMQAASLAALQDQHEFYGSMHKSVARPNHAKLLLIQYPSMANRQRPSSSSKALRGVPSKPIDDRKLTFKIKKEINTSYLHEFAKYDLNGDGTIDHDELEMALRSVLFSLVFSVAPLTCMPSATWVYL
jgi:hypothetical protein